MGFGEALRENPAPRRVGDVRLVYDDQLLIGESSRRFGAAAALLFVCALACGLFSLVALSASDRLAGPIVLGAVAALLLAASIRADQWARARRRFVLNFGTESLRLDAPSRLRGAPTTTVVPFGRVKDVTVTPTPHGYQLLARIEPDQWFVLVDRAGAGEVDALRQLWRVVRAAVGLDQPLS